MIFLSSLAVQCSTILSFSLCLQLKQKNIQLQKKPKAVNLNQKSSLSADREATGATAAANYSSVMSKNRKVPIHLVSVFVCSCVCSSQPELHCLSQLSIMVTHAQM